MNRNISCGLGGKFRRSIDAQIRLDELQASLAQAFDVEACWRTIRASTPDFGFSGMRMALKGRVFEDFWRVAGDNDRLWQLRIPLQASQYINFFCNYDSDTNPVFLSAFADAVERGLMTCPALQRCGTAVTATAQLSLVAADFMKTPPLLTAGPKYA